MYLNISKYIIFPSTKNIITSPYLAPWQHLGAGTSLPEPRRSGAPPTCARWKLASMGMAIGSNAWGNDILPIFIWATCSAGWGKDQHLEPRVEESATAVRRMSPWKHSLFQKTLSDEFESSPYVPKKPKDWMDHIEVKVSAKLCVAGF